MPEENDPYQRAGLVLILGAMLFLILAFLGIGQTIASLLIVSSLGLFLTGVLMLTFTRGLTPDPAVFSFLDVQHQANTATLLSRAGCRDPPVFIRYGELDGGVGQFHALPQGSPLSREAGAPPASHWGRTGIILPPASLPLFRELESRFHLRVPADPGRIPQIIEEVAGEILEVADRVVTTAGADEIRVDLYGFALYPGCRAAKAGGEDVCLLSPCTVCSLLASLVVRAAGRECQVVAVDLDDRQESVHLVISFHPRLRETPAMADAVVQESLGTAEPASSVPVAPDLPAPALITPFPGEPGTPVHVAPVHAGSGEEPSRVMREIGPVSAGEPAGVSAVPAPGVEPEVPWWSRHPGSRRLRYLRKEDSVLLLPREPVRSLPGEPPVPVTEHTASPVAAEPVTPEIPQLSMEELVARAIRDLRTVAAAGPDVPAVARPKSLSAMDPVISSSEYPVPRKPEPVTREEAISPGLKESEPPAPREVTPASAAPSEPPAMPVPKTLVTPEEEKPGISGKAQAALPDKKAAAPKSTKKKEKKPARKKPTGEKKDRKSPGR
ncbi:MAG: hypothetical protein LUO91_08470 [Methanomicrobiales archaeon]|nr:hypothetical protein [Methanomicrobiales archaeon]